MNALPFNGFNQYNHYGDEQLLEGLPTDDNMTRLFWMHNILIKFDFYFKKLITDLEILDFTRLYNWHGKRTKKR